MKTQTKFLRLSAAFADRNKNRILKCAFSISIVPATHDVNFSPLSFSRRKFNFDPSSYGGRKDVTNLHSASQRANVHFDVNNKTVLDGVGLPVIALNVAIG